MKNKYKFYLVILSLILLSFQFFSCSGKVKKHKSINTKNSKIFGVEKSNSEKNMLTIGLSIDTLAIERWQRDLDVFVNRTKELGANVIVQNAGNNTEEQKRQLMYLMDRNVDVIVVLPKQADDFTEIIQKIKNKNIPVISYDRLTRNADIDLYLSIDSQKVGQLMASQMRKITSKNNWYCILGDQGDYNMKLIENGIAKVTRGSPIKIPYTFYTNDWNYDLAYEEMVNIITGGNIPDAIICGNDAVADSVISAIKNYYPDHHIPICGQDAEIAACQNIINGLQDFTIYKPISQLAELTAEYAVKIAKGADINELTKNMDLIDNGYNKIPVVWLEPKVVTKENIDSIIIDSGFHTYNEIYHKK